MILFCYDYTLIIPIGLYYSIPYGLMIKLAIIVTAVLFLVKNASQSTNTTFGVNLAPMAPEIF